MEANKAGVVERLQEAKRKSGKSYRQLADDTGLSNAYVAQLLRCQAQLKPLTAPKLREVLLDLSEELLREMMKPPRSMWGIDFNWSVYKVRGSHGKERVVVTFDGECLPFNEQAKKKIYNVSCDRYFGVGCEIDEETSNQLEGLPSVLFVLPYSYMDSEYKDYRAELFVNGEIVQRSPERQRRVDPVPPRTRDRPKY